MLSFVIFSAYFVRTFLDAPEPCRPTTPRRPGSSRTSPILRKFCSYFSSSRQSLWRSTKSTRNCRPLIPPSLLILACCLSAKAFMASVTSSSLHCQELFSSIKAMETGVCSSAGTSDAGDWAFVPCACNRRRNNIATANAIIECALCKSLS